MVWGLNPAGGQDIQHLSRPALGPNQSPTLWVLAQSWGLRCQGVALTTHSPPSNTEVKERAELYLYPPSVPLWHVIGVVYIYLLKHTL